MQHIFLNVQKSKLLIMNVIQLEIVSDFNLAKDSIESNRAPFIYRGFNIGSCRLKWTQDYLQDLGKNKQVKVHVCEHDNMDFINKNFLYRTLSFNELVKRASTNNKLQDYFINENEKYYLRSLGDDERKDVADIRKQFPELSQDLIVPLLFDESKYFSSVFRISSPKLRLWTHYDIMHNILIQVIGTKKVVLYSPSDIDYLYLKGDKSQVLDIENPDLNKYPLFSKAKKYECVLEAGDILFIPALWFHNVIALDFSIAVNVFWKHLDDAYYDKKDTYGNKDLLQALKSYEWTQKSCKELNSLPQPYKNFYLKRLIHMLNENLE